MTSEAAQVREWKKTLCVANVRPQYLGLQYRLASWRRHTRNARLERLAGADGNGCSVADIEKSISSIRDSIPGAHRRAGPCQIRQIVHGQPTGGQLEVALGWGAAEGRAGRGMEDDDG